MNVTCPSCGAEMDLDVLLAHEDSRQALAALAAMSLPLGKRVLQYVRLFKPATRQMSHSRVVKLIGELLPDLQRGAIRHRGRDWPADLELWNGAIERVLEQRDLGKLKLPLGSHAYLYEVIVGLADKAETQAERAVEADRRSHRVAGEAPEMQPAAAVLVPAPVLVAAPQGPSRYAQKIKAAEAARRAAREAGEEAP